MSAIALAKSSIVSANRLADGTVVFLSPSHDWVEHISGAGLRADQPATEAALAIARRDEAANLVVDAYAFDVRIEAGTIVPITLRDTIRAAGPTIVYAQRA